MMNDENEFSDNVEFNETVGPHMSDRELLGLPKHYIKLRDPFDLGAIRNLPILPAGDLMAIIEDLLIPFSVRMTAGYLLAIMGDVRIKSYEPKMIDIAGGMVEIGLPSECVDSVSEEYQKLGVPRDWILKETPRHAVSLEKYRIGAYPVTNSEYLEFLIETQYEEIPSSWVFDRYPHERSNHPVYTLSHEAVTEYCHWLSRRTTRHFRLPSEAEWEYAAAGADGKEFPWGETFLPDHANTAEEKLFISSPVGCFPKGKSWCGAMDMAGNVEEYVSDIHAAYPGGPHIEDDLTRLGRSYHVARGGSFTRFRDLARTRRRHGHYDMDIYVMGFRLAESIIS